MQNIFQSLKLYEKLHSPFLDDQKLNALSPLMDLNTNLWNQLDYPVGEYWKYVSFKEISSMNLSQSPQEIYPRLKSFKDHYQIQLSPDVENSKAQDHSTDFSFSRLLDLEIEEIKYWLEKLKKKTDLRNPLSLMHLSFLAHTFVLKINKNKTIDRPICLDWNLITKPHDFNVLHLIVDGEVGSQSDIYFADQTSHGLTSMRIDLFLNKNSKINFYRKNLSSNEGISFYHAHCSVEKDAQFKHFDMTLPRPWTRQNVNVDLLGEGSRAELKGAYLSHKNFFCDHHTQILHHVPHTSSKEDYRGILSDETKAVFNGLIGILPNAQKSESELINKNLMLSSRSEINTKPELKIENDDVKAAHGATVGQIDTDQLFYFLSRGLSEDLSHQLLSKAFVAGLTEDESPWVKDFYHPSLDLTLSKMRGDLNP